MPLKPAAQRVDDLLAAHAMGGLPTEGSGGGSAILGMLPFILMFLVLYLLILRPQIKKQKTHQKMIDELKKGDQVVTSNLVHTRAPRGTHLVPAGSTPGHHWIPNMVPTRSPHGRRVATRW